jgi:hypothetical protein
VLQAVVAVAVLASAWHISSLMQTSLQDGVDELDDDPQPCRPTSARPATKIDFITEFASVLDITLAPGPWVGKLDRNTYRLAAHISYVTG